MNDAKFVIRKSLGDYIEALIKDAYADLRGRKITAEWSQIRAFATVTMNNEGPVKIQCNKIVRKWPEPALLGLLSHELSHIIVGDIPDSERLTDEDVINRGLGVYLAFERVIADKYLDHVVGRKRDRYLGYQSIRNFLTPHESQQLDKLLADSGLIA